MRWTPFLVYLFESPSFFLLWQAFQHFLGSILPLIWPKFRYVGFRDQRKQLIKALIGPSEPEHQQVIATVFTPAHADALKSLLNQPFTSTFNHTGAQGELLVIKMLIADMSMVPLKIGLHGRMQVFWGSLEARKKGWDNSPVPSKT
jgi:hypothetical protein